MDAVTPILPGPAAAHKKHQVAQSLREIVADMRAGERLPSVAELQKHFGVANSTIEAAVAALQSEGLVVRRQGSGTFATGSTGTAAPSAPEAPPPSARRKTGQILLTMATQGASPTFHTSMIAALEVEMGRAGFTPLVSFEGDAARRMERAQKQWEEGSIDGFIHIGSLPLGTEIPDGVPAVIVGELPKEDAAVHQVVVNSYDGGYRMGDYLWSLGHRHFAFLAMYDFRPAVPRFQGYFDAVWKHGDVPAEHIVSVRAGWKNVVYPVDVPVLEDALRGLLNQESPPTALFFGYDEIALAAMFSLLQWGYRVPEEITVVGFDDTPGLASRVSPALTTLRMPTQALAAHAVHTLLKAIKNPGTSAWRRLRIPGELIVRESSGPPPPAHPAGSP